MFEHLVDSNTSSLTAAARVCRVWFGLAASVLWRLLATEALASCDASSSRARSVFAPAMRKLSLDGRSAPRTLLAWPRFPAACSLHYDNQRYNRLLNVVLVACALERCGQQPTRAKVGRGTGLDVPAERLMWAQRLRSAQYSYVAYAEGADYHLSGCVGFEALSVFAQRPELFQFVAGSHLAREALGRCLMAVSQPFADIQVIDVPVHSRDVPLLVELATRIGL